MYTKFKQLHYQSRPLFLQNVWDVASAALVEENGATAIATSSAAVAWSLGLSDKDGLSMSVQIALAEQIGASVEVPFSMDIEDGYSADPEAVADFCEKLHSQGVVGINIEDGSLSPAMLSEKIIAIRRIVGPRLFINARTDVYLRGLVPENERLPMAIDRARLYAESGADCIFVPGLLDPDSFAQISRSISLPLNAMVSPGFDVSALVDAGVKRFSTGPGTFLMCYQDLIGSALSFGEMEGLMGSRSRCSDSAKVG